MTSVFMPQIQYVVMFLLIVVIVQLLRMRGIFNDSHQQVFDRLVTELALPAIIFASLATSTIRAEWVVPVLIMIGTIVAGVLISWAICRYYHLPAATTGTIVLLSAFGSTYTVASPVISEIFGPASTEMSLGLVIGTFGVAIPFFTIGVLIAGYFGTWAKGEQTSVLSVLKKFFATPIFLAFVLGLVSATVFAFFNIPGASIYYDVFTDFFAVIHNSLELLVWISIGLLIRPVSLRVLLPVLGIVAGIQMLVLPLLAFCGASVLGQPVMYQQVLVIIAAMPSGAVATVLASRYGCDGRLAAALVISTYLISLVTVPIILMFMF
ncbi:AEC family transporter [Methanoregula sp.]|uniref:AEC family transporter n=1 Tax=Methanoregula sp. TaxID=2052170 RepID=UPI002371133A|nr:AEC family transporter [Methanoregula sp.]MDD1686757.1 AEC family transporter [Methanoregula sp.]